MTDAIYELRALALQRRVDAVDAMQAGDLERVERLESDGDRLYEEARKLGDRGYVVPRLEPSTAPQQRFCVVCRGRFQSERNTAKYCSRKCEGKAARDRERQAADA